jgi:glycosyltransferase involved in cell wall biosynthesis
MKILLCTENHFPGYGGPYTAISQTAYNLYKRNIFFKLIFEKTSNHTYKLDYKEIFKDFDICHFFGIWTPWSIKTFRIAKKLNKKIIISPLGALEPWALSQKSIKKKIAWKIYQKKIINSASYIHATSNEEKEHLIDLGIKVPIVILKHGIEIQENIQLKKQGDKKKAIFFSRIHEKKGLLELVEAWKEINNPNWSLDIYGPVSDMEYLHLVKKTIIKLNLSDQVQIFKPVYDKLQKKNIITSSDCFILPSKSENFGLSIGEALAFGVPVLTTTATPWRSINDYNAGVCFDFSKDNLVKNLRYLFSLQPEQITQMGQNGIKLIKENFDFDIIIEDYINFYKSIL